MKPRFRFTLAEALTAVVVIVVLVAVAIPMWRTHELRTRRQDAIDALLAVQAAQDEYFGQHARYASETQLGAHPPGGLGLTAMSRRGFYRITLRSSEDDLGYWVTARVLPREGAAADRRCVELRLDQNGRRFALDYQGEDRSADCWR